MIIQGTICDVKSFDGSDEENTVLVCETRHQPSQSSVLNYGNRGINMVRVNTSTPRLGSSLPPNNATSIWLDEMKYVDTENVPVTIWMMGFLVPAVTSNYTFSLGMNSGSVGQIYLSTDESSENKVNCCVS